MSRLANIQNKKKESNPLKDWYYSVPAKDLSEARNLIVEGCQINLYTFYAWLRGKNQVPLSQQRTINIIAGKKVFDVPELMTLADISNS